MKCWRMKKWGILGKLEKKKSSQRREFGSNEMESDDDDETIGKWKKKEKEKIKIQTAFWQRQYEKQH